MRDIKLNAEMIKGYTEYFDGRVIACSSYVNDEFKGVLATFSTSDIEYIREKRNGKFLLNRILEETMENVYTITGKTVTKKRLLNAIKNRDVFLCYNTNLSSLDNLKNVSEDVFYLGNMPNYKESIEYNILFSEWYFSIFLDQQEHPLTYSHFKEKNIDTFIKKRFTDKLIASALNNEIYSFSKLLKEFNGFFKNTRLEYSVKEFSEKFEDFYITKKIDYGLVDNYINMLEGAHIENFDKAIYFRNKIKNEKS